MQIDLFKMNDFNAQKLFILKRCRRSAERRGPTKNVEIGRKSAKTNDCTCPDYAEWLKLKVLLVWDTVKKVEK